MSGSYFSYRIHTQDLPELLSKQANESKARSDFQSEVNWIAKYLMVIGQADTKEKMAGQTRFAIAVDSQLRQEDELSGTSNIFLAIRQLEAIDALIEETPRNCNKNGFNISTNATTRQPISSSHGRGVKLTPRCRIPFWPIARSHRQGHETANRKPRCSRRGPGTTQVRDQVRDRPATHQLSCHPRNAKQGSRAIRHSQSQPRPVAAIQ